MDLKAILKHPALNKWNLFLLIAVPMSVAIAAASINSDLSEPAGVSSMISVSVRWAVPFINLIACTSALYFLFPGVVTAWLLRNRRYFGMCFAVAMGWQAIYIYIISNAFRGYYFEEVFVLRNELEGSVGYIALGAMVATSFAPVRRYFSAVQWRLIHLTGLYFLWSYAFATYWWNVFYYEDPEVIDYAYYWMGFTAFALRIFAWWKKRRQKLQGGRLETQASRLHQGFGAVLIGFGLLSSATGHVWYPLVEGSLYGPQWSLALELWLPYWPFEPFYPLIAIAMGAWLCVAARPRSGLGS